MINHRSVIYKRIPLVVNTFIEYVCVDWEIYVAEKVRAFHSSFSAKFKLEK